LLQLSINGLVCGNCCIIDEGRIDSRGNAEQGISWSIILAFDVPDVCSELRNVVNMTKLSRNVGRFVGVEDSREWLVVGEDVELLAFY